MAVTSNKEKKSLKIKRAGGIVTSLTLFFLKLFTKPLPALEKDTQRKANMAVLNRIDPGSFIDDQSRLSSLSLGHASGFEEKLFFKGKKFSAALNSCEAIAVYNALTALKIIVPFPDILFDLSTEGIALHGVFGCSPLVIKPVLEKYGMQVKEYTGKRLSDLLLSDENKNDAVYIFSSFNKGINPFSMIHTMCISCENDIYRVHNDFEGNRTYASLKDAVTSYNKAQSRVIIIHEISVKNL